MSYIIPAIFIGILVGILTTLLALYFLADTSTIYDLCADKFPYTNSTIEMYKSCINNPQYYNVTRGLYN